MKTSVSRIERMLEEVEAKLTPRGKTWLSAVVHEEDAEAVVKEKQEKALAEHVARHPEDAGLTVADFNWMLCEIVKHVPWTDYDERLHRPSRPAEGG
jgi:hypothetical protein